jgi:hypothetical protein
LFTLKDRHLGLALGGMQVRRRGDDLTTLARRDHRSPGTKGLRVGTTVRMMARQDHGGYMYALPDIGPLLTAADFEPYVGKIFLVDAQPKPLEIRLEEILRRPPDPLLARQPFTLIFTSALNALLLSAIYRMQPSGGRLIEMFLVPTQTGPSERRYYHAVFN